MLERERKQRESKRERQDDLERPMEREERRGDREKERERENNQKERQRARERERERESAKAGKKDVTGPQRHGCGASKFCNPQESTILAKLQILDSQHISYVMQCVA